MFCKATQLTSPPPVYLLMTLQSAAAAFAARAGVFLADSAGTRQLGALLLPAVYPSQEAVNGPISQCAVGF